MLTRKTSALLIFLIVAMLFTAAFSPAAFRMLAAFNAGDDSFVRNGKDIIWYSGDLTGETARVDGATGNITATGNVDVGGDLNLTPATAITVTDGTVITPTGAYQPLIGSGTITAATVATAAATVGDMVVLINTASATINIADSGAVSLSAAAALGQYDTLTILFDGTAWRETARSNN
jgi:hypothetical protein